MYNWWWLLIKMKPVFDANGNEYESWKSRESTVYTDFRLCPKWMIYCCWAYRKQWPTRVTAQPFDPSAEAFLITNSIFDVRRTSWESQKKAERAMAQMEKTSDKDENGLFTYSRVEWNETVKSSTRTTKMLRFIFLFCFGCSGHGS